MYKSQKGFALIEALLIIITIAAIGGIGWYAIHTKHQTDKILSQADKISQSTPTKTSSNSSSSNSTLTIKEWNVKALYNGKLHLIYKITNDKNSSIAAFSSKELASVSSICTDSGGGMIIKADGSMHIYAPSGGVAPAGSSAENYGTDNGSVADFVNQSPGIYSKIGNEYYWFAPDQFDCGRSSSASITQIQQETADVVKSIAKNLQSLPQ